MTTDTIHDRLAQAPRGRREGEVMGSAWQHGSTTPVLGKLVGGVAHDFNNLLTVILGYTEILLSRKQGSDPERDLLTEIHRAGERAESLTRQLLAFTHRPLTERRILDLNQVLSESEKMLRRLLGEDVLMTTIFSPTLCPVQADPGQLEQLILNLAVQARDAMPCGGRLTIETDNVERGDARDPNASGTANQRFALLAISHTGPNSISDYSGALPHGSRLNPDLRRSAPSHAETIAEAASEPFSGLDLVRAFVGDCGGHLEVNVEPTGGTTWTLYLPEAHASASPSEVGALVHACPGGAETILLIEDDDSVRALACHVLQSCGYTVLEAAHGEAAIQLVETYQAPIHLLVSDVVMPHLCGRGLVERLLALRPDLRVLFLSGYTNEALERYGLAGASYAYLQKPFTSSALAEMVRGVLDEARK
jgi:two-component system cell cycle sensor histidine kinase/response regulator CckA